MTSDNELALLEALGEILEQKKLLAAKEKELRSALLGVFEQTPDGTIAAGNYAVTIKHMPGRKTLNKEALEEDGIDLEPYYKTGKPYLTVSAKPLS